MKCITDCLCKRHSPSKCLEGCNCKKHSLRPKPFIHIEGCTCKVHTNNGGKPCLEGCTCGRHSKPKGAKRSEECRDRMSKARILYFEEHPEAREATAASMREYFRKNPEALVHFHSTGNPDFGKWTKEQIERRVHTRRLRNNFPTALELSKAFRTRGPTNLEKILLELLEERFPGLSIVQEFPFGKFYVYDFAIPELELFCEADGKYWHSFPDAIKRDKAKDTYARNHGWEIQRYSEEDLTTWYKNKNQNQKFGHPSG